MSNVPVLVKDDPWLEPYTYEILSRQERFEKRRQEIEKVYNSLENFASAYDYFGLNHSTKEKGWWYREWAPQAEALYLIGDFNNWDRTSHPMSRNEGGIWEIFVSEDELKENSRVKVHVLANGKGVDRIPAYIKRVVQDDKTYDFCGQPVKKSNFKWTDQDFKPEKVTLNPVIYEAHVGMAQEKEGVGTYKEFRQNVLPRIKRLGYNVIQLMAIQEHPYYGSFGYHVSSFFAPSSRFGTPDELRELVNAAHNQGMAVIIDLVHSHAVKNIAEGLNEFDGSDDQYFHPGGRGNHDSWDSKLFNYGKWEVQQFLLSNVAYWIKEFHIDGYRFDGVTSMLYMHHGNFVQFDHYDKYFIDKVEWDAITYLQLANTLVHSIQPGAITVAEDMSGMPGLCRTIADGGVGFDFRLGMGIPDYWIKILKHKRDEDWNIHEMWSVMTNRRYKEKTVAYAESHDQAIVGDKSIAFWLMDKEMYWHMQISDQNLIVDRGIALHKIIRLFTATLGGEAYLNFIGNEFGHPEWVDFPREGNNWSYHYARRQWSLVDDDNLKYKYLNTFDQQMVELLIKYNIPGSLAAKQLNMDDVNKVIIFERNNLIFAFNFHTDRSIPDYKMPSIGKGKYKVILDSDSKESGGFGRVDHNIVHETIENDLLSIYLPNRTALVLHKI